MNKIMYNLGLAAVAAYVSVVGTNCRYITPADAQALQTSAPLPKKVELNRGGLESLIPPDTLSHGMKDGRYQVDGDLTIRNGKTALPGPLRATYSLCLPAEGNVPMCFAGKSEKLENGLAPGQVVAKEFHLKKMGPTDEIVFQSGKRIPVRGTSFEITVRVESANTDAEFYKAHHTLPKAGDYVCKKNCNPTK